MNETPTYLNNYEKTSDDCSVYFSGFINENQNSTLSSTQYVSKKLTEYETIYVTESNTEITEEIVKFEFKIKVVIDSRITKQVLMIKKNLKSVSKKRKLKYDFKKLIIFRILRFVHKLNPYFHFKTVRIKANLSELIINGKSLHEYGFEHLSLNTNLKRMSIRKQNSNYKFVYDPTLFELILKHSFLNWNRINNKIDFESKMLIDKDEVV